MPHQRRRSAASRSGARARARARQPRRIDAGERRRVLRRLDRQRRVGALGLGQLGGGKPSRCASRAAAHHRSAAPGSSVAQQRPRSALEQLALDGEQQRRGQRASSARRPAGPAARRGSSRTAAARTPAGPSALTARVELGELLGEVLAQHVADPVALLRRGEAVAAEQLLLARDRLGAGDLPAHREPLEQELDRALPGVLARERRARRAAAYSRRVAGDIAPRSTSTSPAGLRYSASGAARASAAPRRRLRLPISGRRGALELGGDVAGQRLGVAGPRALGASSASLRIEARACSVSRLNAACGSARRPVEPVCDVERVEAVATSARAPSRSRNSAIMPGAWPGIRHDAEAAHVVALLDACRRSRTGPPSHRSQQVRVDRPRVRAQLREVDVVPAAVALGVRAVVGVAEDRRAEARRRAAVVDVAVAEHDAVDAAERAAAAAIALVMLLTPRVEHRDAAALVLDQVDVHRRAGRRRGRARRRRRPARRRVPASLRPRACGR